MALRDKVNNLYKENLGRNADKEGLDYWTNRAKNASLSEVEKEFENSSEAKMFNSTGNARRVKEENQVDGYDYASSGDDISYSGGENVYSGSLENNVTQFYDEYLGRMPDKGGLDYWTSRADEVGLDAVKKEFENSTEASIFEESGTPYRVSSKEQVEGFEYQTDDSLVNYDDDDYGNRLKDFFNEGLNNGNISVSQNDKDQMIYTTNSGGTYTFDDPVDTGNDYVGDLGVGSLNVPNTEVTPNQTVQGQLANILDSDSPLMKRAATQGAQAANSRGLLNSSMASQAAQGAMIDRATPIASQDAETNFQNAQANAGREQQDYMQRLGFEQELASTAQRYEIDSALLEQEGNQAMEKLYGTSLANAWGVMGNNVTDIVAQTMQNIQAIQGNPNINAEDKTRMIQDALDMRDQDVQFQAELYSTLPDTLDDIGVFPERVT